MPDFFFLWKRFISPPFLQFSFFCFATKINVALIEDQLGTIIFKFAALLTSFFKISTLSGNRHHQKPIILSFQLFHKALSNFSECYIDIVVSFMRSNFFLTHIPGRDTYLFSFSPVSRNTVIATIWQVFCFTNTWSSFLTFIGWSAWISNSQVFTYFILYDLFCCMYITYVSGWGWNQIIAVSLFARESFFLNDHTWRYLLLLLFDVIFRCFGLMKLLLFQLIAIS